MHTPYLNNIPNCSLKECGSDDLSTIQRGLEWMTLNPGPIDGVYGSKTSAAWAKFAERTDLPDDEIVNDTAVFEFNALLEGISVILDEATSGETEVQVVSESLLAVMLDGFCDAHAAYVWATVQHETNQTWAPVREAYWLSEDWRKNNLRYYPYYGRGFVQITWDANYQKYQDITGEPLIDNPDLALQDDVAMFILCHGFVTGVFTGKKLTDYVHTNQNYDFYNARRCINGTDCAQQIADIAQGFLNGDTNVS